MLTAAERRAFLRKLGAERVEVPEAEWRAFERLLEPLKLAKGERFVEPGDATGRVGLVRSGLFRFYYVDADGREATKAFRGPGELAAPYAELLMGVPSRTYIEALEDSELLAARYEDLVALYARHRCWLELGRRVAETFYVTKERREFELLQLPARERYRLFSDEYPGLAGRIPQYHVASYLGITPVALSRLISAARPRRRAR